MGIGDVYQVEVVVMGGVRKFEVWGYVMLLITVYVFMCHCL